MTLGRFSHKKLILLAAVVVPLAAPALPLLRPTIPAPAVSTQKPSRSRPSPATLPKELPVPFRVGEKLNYRVSWSSFAIAAAAELTIPERRDLYGWQTWHFRASAHTVSPVRTLFPIDDQFDSYTDTASLESRQYENYLSEMGRKLNQQWRFVPEGQESRVPGAAVVVLPGTRDPLGMLYSLRFVDWEHTPEIRVPVYDGHKMYEVRARREMPFEAVEVPAGKFSAARIALHLFQHKAEISGISFMLWVASDPARTPVLMRAELPFGSLRIELTSLPL